MNLIHEHEQRMYANSLSDSDRVLLVTHYLQKLTPGGSEFQTAPECLNYIAEKLDNLREQNKSLMKRIRALECGK